MTKLVVAIAVGICMGGFSALSANAEEPGAPGASSGAEEPEIYESADTALIYLTREFHTSGRFERSRRVVDTAVRSKLEREFPEFAPRLRLAQIVLTMLEGDTKQAADDLRKFSAAYEDDGSCVSGFTIAAIKIAETELVYQTDGVNGFGKQAAAAEYAFRLKDRGGYCAREAHKLSAAYYILLAEKYARDGDEDDSIETFMKAIAVAHTAVDPSIEERVLRFVSVNFEAGFSDLATELKARADAIGAYKNWTIEEIIDSAYTVYGLDEGLPLDEDPSILVVYLIHALIDRHRIFVGPG